MNNLINNLKTLKLSDHESKVFLVLLKGSLMSASEIAKKAGVNRTNVYSILKSFVERGFINEIETNAILQYEMIDLDIIADKIDADLAAEKKKKVQEIRSTLEDLKPHFRTEQEDNSNVNVELIRGYNQHRQAKQFEFVKNAKTEMLLLVRLEGFASSEVDETAKKFIENGGSLRSIYESTLNFKIKKENETIDGTYEDMISLLENFTSYGEKIKIGKMKLPNMLIIDRKFVIMNINDKTVPRHNEADIIIKNKEFAESMAEMFELYWQSAVTLSEFKQFISDSGTNK
jgi:sugar-specific transcriptional regulator TrmB